MLKVRTGRIMLCFGMCILLGMLVMGTADARLFGLIKSKKVKKEAVSLQSLLVFPFDQDASVKLPDSFGQDVAIALKGQLTGSTYSVYMFDNKLAPIVRAKDENDIKDDDIKSPFADDNAKPLKLARIVASDMYLVGSIDDCSVDASAKKAQMTLRADLYDCNSGKLVKTFLVSGKAPESVKTADSDELRSLAANDAIAKLKLEMVNAGSLDNDEPAKDSKPVKK